MKNKELNKKVYKKLINKIFMQTIIFMVVSIIIVLAIRILVQGKFGEFITTIISRILDVEMLVARNIYYITVRKYFDLIIIISIMIIFAVFYKVFLSWFTKYFDEVIEGIDSLANKEKEIKLSYELKFIEERLNSIRCELKASEEMQRNIEKRKNDLIIYLAHDIKTPLTSVIGYLNLLQENKNMTIAEKAKYIGIALDKAYRLENLINEFFEITRYNLETVPLNKEKIDLSYMLVQIVDEAYPHIKSVDKTVKLTLKDELIVCVDKEKIARVMNNILKNAITYSEDKSEIEIEAYKDENIFVEFKSCGTIDEETLKNIFDKFYRADFARQTTTGGAGLGLAIAKDIMTLHNGDIVARCADEKTIFKIIIPC
ncbi:MAG: sensor histidine kinase [Sarcina sp.]